MRVLSAVALAATMLAAPVLAQDTEQAAIEAACNAYGLDDCACIAQKAMDTDATTRRLVLVSLEEPERIDTIVADGGATVAELNRLWAFQIDAVTSCAEAAKGNG